MLSFSGTRLHLDTEHEIEGRAFEECQRLNVLVAVRPEPAGQENRTDKPAK
jgi:hypothetical protein